jgi:hypothetical protein
MPLHNGSCNAKLRQRDTSVQYQPVSLTTPLSEKATPSATARGSRRKNDEFDQNRQLRLSSQPQLLPIVSRTEL